MSPVHRKALALPIATHLAAEGAAVVVNYSSSKEGADRVVAEIVRKGGKAMAVQAEYDVMTADIKHLFSGNTKNHLAKLDILVNNAGVYEFAPLEEMTPEHFHKMFDLNRSRLIARLERSAGRTSATSGGSIVNISSVASTSTLPNISVYSATKASVNAITKCSSERTRRHVKSA